MKTIINGNAVTLNELSSGEFELVFTANSSVDSIQLQDDCEHTLVLSDINTQETTPEKQPGVIGFSEEPEGKKWMGQVVTSEEEAPTNPSDYKWTKTKGENGENANAINLLLNGDNAFSTSNYQVAQYTLSEDLIAGEKYTITLKGTKAVTQNFGLWQNGGASSRSNLTAIGNGLYQLTFEAVATTSGYERILRIYQPPSGSVGQATIEWATVVKGAVGLEKFVKSPEQTQQEIDDKASNSALDGVSDRVDSVDDRQKRLENNMNAYLEQQAQYQDWLKKVEDDTKNANELISRVNNAQAELVTELDNQAQKWVTQEGFIQFDGETNTMSIASENDGTQMIIDDEALRFFSGGAQVAAITNQYLLIDRGIFTESAQIGNHKWAPLASDPDHFILSYVKGGDS